MRSCRPWGAAVGAGAAAFLFGKFWRSNKRIKRFKNTCDEELLDAFDKAKNNLEHVIDIYDSEVAVYQALIKQGRTTVKKLEETLYHLPDVNNDNLIDQTEFDEYMTDYRRKHPYVREEDMPSFSDMDYNKDGQITFEGTITLGLCSKDNT